MKGSAIVAGSLLVMVVALVPALSMPAGGSGREAQLTSRTFVVTGYEETVTVNASLDQLSEFFADPRNLMFPGIEMEPLKPAQNEKFPGLGSILDYHMEWHKLKFPGRMIVVKRDNKNVWFVKDDPLAFASMAWKMEPADDGTRVTLKWEYAMPQDKLDILAGKIITAAIPIDEWNQYYDLMLANLQASFNPALDPQDLVRDGLRGESYQTLYQVQEAEILIKATPQKVEQWLDHPSRPFWGLAPDEDDCLYQAPSQERAIYCPVRVSYGGQELPMDAFSLAGKSRGIPVRNVYTMVMDMPGVMQIKLEPALSGARLRLSWGIETPDPRQPAGLDKSLFIATLPERVSAAALAIKEGIEGVR